MVESVCPNCLQGTMVSFHEVHDVPVHSVLLMHTRQQAVDYPRGDIHLAFCDRCGFISNVAFEASLHEYSEEYEATQSYSPTFNTFNRALAQRLIDTYDLHQKTIIEIGCGHGEFLILLCDLGPNQGIGFDPAYRAERIDHPAKQNIRFVQDFYSEKYAAEHGDFIVCKMTLEHIPDTAAFLNTIRRSIADRVGTQLFFQIPNGSYVLQSVAFWDIYYEHCSYFSKASLATLFVNAGFDVIDMFTDYDDQYLMIEARASAGKGTFHGPLASLVEDTHRDVSRFGSVVGQHLQAWRQALHDLAAAGKKIIIWGSGSKAVAFISALHITSEVDYVVDINPNKWGAFMPGSGHQIISPAQLEGYDPDVVIIMNPIYETEIRRQLDDLGLSPLIMTVESATKSS